MGCACKDRTSERHINICLPKKREFYAANKEHMREVQRDWNRKNIERELSYKEEQIKKEI